MVAFNEITATQLMPLIGTPQAAGLLAISMGLSRMFREDTAQVRPK